MPGSGGITGALTDIHRELNSVKRERARLLKKKPRGWRNAVARHNVFVRALEEDAAYLQRDIQWAASRKKIHARWLRRNPQYAPARRAQ